MINSYFYELSISKLTAFFYKTLLKHIGASNVQGIIRRLKPKLL